MERKYRQRGYMSEERPEKREKPPAARGPRETIGPRPINMPGRRMLSRCAECGGVLPAEVDPHGACPKCHAALHSCKQCTYFDTAARWECTQPIKLRITKKHAANQCGFFSLKVTVERETSAEARRPMDARQAFENLFKK